MSWIGGSLSSLTGQLSNFTKEVLTEGREEVSDHAAELSVAQQRSREIELQCAAQKQEMERILSLNEELEERAQSAELQIGTVSKKYRGVLEQKEEEIKGLKQRQLEMQDLHEKIMDSGGSPNPGCLGSGVGGGVGVYPSGGDELDFGDVISSQHEINRLSDTVHRLQAERDHWKHLAKKHSIGEDEDEEASDRTVRFPDERDLRERIKDLEHRLQLTVNEHHLELAALQDAQAHRLGQSKHRYEDQLAALQRCIESSGQTPDSSERRKEVEDGNIRLVLQLETHNSELQAKLQGMQRQVEVAEAARREEDRAMLLLARQLEKLQQEKMQVEQLLEKTTSEKEQLAGSVALLEQNIKALQSQLIEVQHTNVDQDSLIARLNVYEDADVVLLKNQLEVAEMKIGELMREREQASNSEMLLEVQLARQKFSNETEARQMQLLKEKQLIVDRMVQTGYKSTDLEEDAKSIEAEHKMISMEATEMIKQLGDPEHQELVAGLITALELENNVLKEQNVVLQTQVHQLDQKLADLSIEVKSMDISLDPLSSDSIHSDKTLENERMKEAMKSNENRMYKASSPGLRSSRAGSNVSDRSDIVNQQFLTELEECESASLTSSYSEMSQRNKELDDQVKSLEVQIDSYERDIAHFEMVKTDWKMERRTLEEILTKMRTQLRAKESSLTLVNAQKGLLEVKKQSPRMARETSPDDKSSEGELNIERELEQLQEQIEELTQGSAQLENERDILLLEKGRLVEEINKIMQLNQELEERNARLGNRTDDHKEQLAVRTRVEQLERELDLLGAERDSLITSLDDLDQQHQQAIEHILQSRDGLQQKLKQTSGELESANQQLEAHLWENADLKEQVANLSSHLKEARDHEAQPSVAEDQSEQLALLTARVADLTNALKESEKAHLKVQQENHSFRGKLKNTAESETQELLEWRSKIKELELALELSEKNCRTLKYEIDAIRSNVPGQSVDHVDESISKATEPAQKFSVVYDSNDEIEISGARYNELAEISDWSNVEMNLQDELEIAAGKDDELLGNLLTDALHSTCKLFGKEYEAGTNIEKSLALNKILKEFETLKQQYEVKAAELELVNLDMNAKFTKSTEAREEMERELVAANQTIESLQAELIQTKEDRHRSLWEVESWEEIAAEDSEKIGKEATIKAKLQDLELESTSSKQSKSSSSDDGQEKYGELVHRKDELELQVKEYENRVAAYQLEIEKYEGIKNVAQASEIAQVEGSTSEETYAKSEGADGMKRLELECQSVAEIQELEMESSSSKESKESSSYGDDGQEKYGELVQRKDDLAMQVRELEQQVSAYKLEKEKLEKDVVGLKEVIPTDGSSSLDHIALGDVITDTGIEFQKECQRLQEELRESESNLQMSLQNLQQLEKEKLKVDAEASTLKGKLGDLLEQQLDLEKEVCHLQQEKARFQEDSSEGNRRSGETQTDFELETSLLEKKLEEQGVLITEHENSRRSLEEKIKDEESTIQNLMERQKEFDNVQLEAARAKKEFDNSLIGFNEKLQNCERVVVELNRQNESLTEQATQAKEEALKAASNAQAEIADKDIQLCALNGILKVYKEQLDPELADAAAKVSSANESFDKDTDNEFEMRKAAYTKTIEEHESQIHDLMEEVDHLKEIIIRSLGAGDSDNRNGEIMEKLGEQIRTLQVEKEQIMSILNEKSRENSSLKSEVHQLMDVISAEKAAITKLQLDNQELLKGKKSSDDEASEMSKEAMKNLARIIRDKEMEIEALHQKNKTLLDVLHQAETPNLPSMGDGTAQQLQSLLQERENLAKQVTAYQADRDQIINALTQKHQESVSYHAEIERLIVLLNTEGQKMESLQQQYSAVARQYEDKQKVLFDTQNEMIVLKQRVIELEEQQMDIKAKYVQLLEKNLPGGDKDELGGDSTGGIVEISYAELSSKNLELEKLAKDAKDKDVWLFEKDKLLHEQQQQLQRIQEELGRKDEDVASGKRQIESLSIQLGSVQNEVQNSRSECASAMDKVEDMRSETVILKEANNKLTMNIREKEFELSALRKKVETLSELVQNRENSEMDSGEMKRLLTESEGMQQHAQEFQLERDQVILALNQRHRENQDLQHELHTSRDHEERMQMELERLRSHLLQVEESYTNEALHAEEREKELRNRLAAAEETTRNASSSYTNASHQATVQVQSLQEQLHAIAKQRDEAYFKLDYSENEVQKYATSLQTLQLVLEQFQQEKERELVNLGAKQEQLISEERRRTNQIQEEMLSLQMRLEEASEALAAASRLSEKLDHKEEMIAALKQEVVDRDNDVKKLKNQMNELASHGEGKVDRTITKNLVVNYFSIPHYQRLDVLRIIATVLDFNHEERIKTGLEVTQTGWIFSGWLGNSPRPARTPPARSRPAAGTGALQPTSVSSPSNQSLSEAFVKFLETESQPILAVRYPTDVLVEDVARKKAEQQHKVAYNPFTVVATSSGSVQLQEPHTQYSSPVWNVRGESGEESHLLMKPIAATLPSFSPIPVTEHGTIATNVLREVLKQDQ